MGIDVNKIISLTFIIGGMLGGVASIVFSIYNNTIYFQMGYRIGMGWIYCGCFRGDWQSSRSCLGRNLNWITASIL